MKKTLLVDMICYFFIFLFLYTGAAKLMEIHQFREQLISSPLMSGAAGLSTWSLPIGELWLGIGLFIPRIRLYALYATAILMTLFTVYVITLLFIDNQLSCSCGGIIEELSPKQHTLFNSACVVLSGLAIALERRPQSPQRVQWLPATAVLMIFLFIGWTLITAFSTPVAPKTGLEGRLLPAFDLLLPDSVTHFNTADIPTGKPFVVIGFQPYCAHCQAETRDILKNIRQLNNIPIYYVTPYPFPQMRAFYGYFKLGQYPNITIGRDARDSFMHYFKVHSVPYTAVFDAHRRLKKVFATQVDAGTLSQALKQ